GFARLPGRGVFEERLPPRPVAVHLRGGNLLVYHGSDAGGRRQRRPRNRTKENGAVSWLPRLPSRRFIRLVLLLVPVLAVAAYLELPALRAQWRFRAAEKARKRRDFADARGYLLANLA